MNHDKWISGDSWLLFICVLSQPQPWPIWTTTLKSFSGGWIGFRSQRGMGSRLEAAKGLSRPVCLMSGRMAPVLLLLRNRCHPVWQFGAAEGWHLWREETDWSPSASILHRLVSIWLLSGYNQAGCHLLRRRSLNWVPFKFLILNRCHLDWLWPSWGLYLDACGRGRSIGTVLRLLTPVKGRSWLGLWIPIHLFSSQVLSCHRHHGPPAKGRSWLSYPRCRRWSIWRKGKGKSFAFPPCCSISMDFVVGLYVAWNAASWQSRSTTTGLTGGEVASWLYWLVVWWVASRFFWHLWAGYPAQWIGCLPEPELTAKSDKPWLCQFSSALHCWIAPSIVFGACAFSCWGSFQALGFTASRCFDHQTVTGFSEH